MCTQFRPFFRVTDELHYTTLACVAVVRPCVLPLFASQGRRPLVCPPAPVGTDAGLPCSALGSGRAVTALCQPLRTHARHALQQLGPWVVTNDLILSSMSKQHHDAKWLHTPKQDRNVGGSAASAD